MGEFTKRQIRTGNRRLLKLARILDKADALHKERGEPAFDLGVETHPCGTPACAWGHYAFSSKALALRFTGPCSFDGKVSCNYNDAQPEFALADREELNELFGFTGCGDAKTAKAAAKYIRSFVKRREAALERA